MLLLTWSIYCATKRLPHSASSSSHHTELMALLLTSSTISRRYNYFCTADVTAACHEVHTYINIRLSWTKRREITWNRCRKEKYILVQKFHVLSTTGLVNTWYCFVVCVMHFGLSNAVYPVGRVGRGDKTTKETENLQSNTTTVTLVAKMSAVLTIDNCSKIT